MTIEQIANLLVRSGLSSQPEAQELIAGHETQCREYGTTESVESFCGFLVATNLFTEWQCDKLRMGKWKGFYLGNYLILEHISKDCEFAHYKARDTRTGKLVRMTVTPAQGPNIEYRVHPYSD